MAAAFVAAAAAAAVALAFPALVALTHGGYRLAAMLGAWVAVARFVLGRGTRLVTFCWRGTSAVWRYASRAGSSTTDPAIGQAIRWSGSRRTEDPSRSF